jgi:predicted O-methyltransferase YrrM
MVSQKALESLIEATPGFMPKSEGQALHSLALWSQASRSEPLVEIGSYCGKSTLYLAAAAQIHNATVLSIDHHVGSEENYPPFPYTDEKLIEPHTNRINTLLQFYQSIRLAGFEDTVVGLVGTSATLAQAISVTSSLVFIDGAHGALPAWVDYHGWVATIKIGGILAIHDVFEDPRDGGQVPFGLYVAAQHSGEFEPILQVGSLRGLLRRRQNARSASTNEPRTPVEIT